MNAADALARSLRYFLAKHICHCEGCAEQRKLASDALVDYSESCAREISACAAIEEIASKVRHAGL